MLNRLTALLVAMLLVCNPAQAVLPTIFATQSTGNVAASLLDTNFTFLESQGVQAFAPSGSSNTYVATPSDAWVTGYSSYVGRALTVKPNFTNTGASTINVSGLGAAAIYKNASGVATALASGDIVSGLPAILICDGTGFILINPTNTVTSGALLASNNLSDLSSLSTSLTNLGFSSSLNTTGYQKFPGGLIEEWGQASNGSAVSGSFSFPLTFPNAIYTAILTDSINDNPAIYITALSTSSVSWTKGNNSASTIYWIAIGK